MLGQRLIIVSDFHDASEIQAWQWKEASSPLPPDKTLMFSPTFFVICSIALQQMRHMITVHA